MTKNVFLMLSLLLLSLPTFAQRETYVFKQFKDGKEMKLDVYRPQHPRADSTCVIYVFGGGFVTGARDNKSSALACSRLTENGYTAVSIDYRLGVSPTVLDSLGKLRVNTMFRNAISMAVEDLSDAVAYVWNHAEELGVRRDRIVLTGSSAGAITVLQTDYSRVNGLPAAKALPSEFVPLAVISYSGGIMCPNRQLKYAKAPAPTCFFHGMEDRIVNYKSFRGNLKERLNGTKVIAKLFRKERYPYWALSFEDLGHEVSGYLPSTMLEFNAFVDMVDSGRRTFYDMKCSDTKFNPTQWSKMNIFDLYKTK